MTVSKIIAVTEVHNESLSHFSQPVSEMSSAFVKVTFKHSSKNEKSVCSHTSLSIEARYKCSITITLYKEYVWRNVSVIIGISLQYIFYQEKWKFVYLYFYSFVITIQKLLDFYAVFSKRSEFSRGGLYVVPKKCVFTTHLTQLVTFFIICLHFFCCKKALICLLSNKLIYLLCLAKPTFKRKR